MQQHSNLDRRPHILLALKTGDDYLDAENAGFLRHKKAIARRFPSFLSPTCLRNKHMHERLAEDQGENCHRDTQKKMFPGHV